MLACGRVYIALQVSLREKARGSRAWLSKAAKRLEDKCLKIYVEYTCTKKKNR